jgi:hypothetical protein
MKLSTQDTQYLETILATAAIGGIEAVVIEDGFVRGVNPDKTFAIISDNNVPAFPQKIGIARLNSLTQRISIFKGKDTVIDAKESERGEISAMEISSGKNKVQFRCTSTMLIKAPKSINDEVNCDVAITKDEMKMILDAIRVMGAKKVTLALRKDGSVQFEIADESNDSFKIVLEYSLPDGKNTEVYYYQASVLAALLKAKMDFDTVKFKLGQMGTIKTEIIGHEVTILPQIGDDTEE